MHKQQCWCQTTCAYGLVHCEIARRSLLTWDSFEVVSCTGNSSKTSLDITIYSIPTRKPPSKSTQSLHLQNPLLAFPKHTRKLRRPRADPGSGDHSPFRAKGSGETKWQGYCDSYCNRYCNSYVIVAITIAITIAIVKAIVIAIVIAMCWLLLIAIIASQDGQVRFLTSVLHCYASRVRTSTANVLSSWPAARNWFFENGYDRKGRIRVGEERDDRCRRSVQFAK